LAVTAPLLLATLALLILLIALLGHQIPPYCHHQK
jgi:hypothetical protein